MKPTLQLKLSQQLRLTPQLQQSIRLLQLSTLELNQEIERIVQENPLLELTHSSIQSQKIPRILIVRRQKRQHLKLKMSRRITLNRMLNGRKKIFFLKALMKMMIMRRRKYLPDH